MNSAFILLMGIIFALVGCCIVHTAYHQATNGTKWYVHVSGVYGVITGLLGFYTCVYSLFK